MISLEDFELIKPGDKLVVVKSLDHELNTCACQDMYDFEGKIVTARTYPYNSFLGDERRAIHIEEDNGWNWSRYCFVSIMRPTLFNVEEFI